VEDETRPTDAVPDGESSTSPPERERERLFKYDERRADPALSPRSPMSSEPRHEPPRPTSQPVDEPTAAMPAPSWNPPRPTSAPASPPAPRVDPSFGAPAPSVEPRTDVRPATQAAAPTLQRRAQPQPSDRGSTQVRRLRRGRIAIRKVDPWAVMKFSLVFYFCMLVVVMLVVGIIFTALKAFGVIDNIQKLLRDLDFFVTITGGVIFRWVFLLGLAGTVIASVVTMFMAFLYNLIADVVGGIELVVTERE
jgi:hypothetical protein